MSILSEQFQAMALEIFLVLIVGVMLVSPISCASLPCQHCTAQDIRITSDVPGKCDVCWPCSLLECHEGRGPSFACGTTVYRGSQIHCVDCAPGKNFSDSVGSQQCQPCGVCAGEHERVLVECTAKSDVKCECEDDFYRNETTMECLPCSSCCMEDGNIEEKCKGDGGGIGTKCKFKELQPSTCLSSSTAPETTVSIPVRKPYSALITSSFIMTSFLHAIPTPLLDSITPTAPASSETVHIKATLASDRHSKIQGMSSTVNVAKPSEETKIASYHMPKALVIVIWLLLVMACSLVIGCVICVVKMFRSWGYLLGSIGQPIRSNDLELQARECGNGQNSSSHSGVTEPLLANAGATSSPLTTTDEASKTAVSSDLSKSVLLINLPEQNGTDTKPEKGIPSSLGDGPTHQVFQPPMQTHGQFNPPGSFQSFATATRGWNGGDLKHQGPATVQWSALSQTDKYKTKMQEAPFRLQHDICLELDIPRNDGKDVRLFAEKLGIKTREFERLQQAAVSIWKATTTSVILKERFLVKKPSGTVGDFVDIMLDMERGDIIDLINEWQE